MMKISKFNADGECSLLLPPVPASRPRVGRWGTFYSKNYAQWKEQARLLLQDQELPRTSAPLAVMVEQVCRKPKTTKRLYPRGDCDNHAKGPLDAITKADGAWDDDDQIIWLAVTKRFAEQDEQPRSIVKWMELQI